MTFRTLALATTTSIIALAVSATGTMAQTTDGKLDVITVTAQKKEENIKDVPISVATVGGEKLDVLRSSGMDVRFLSARVPSLQIESSFGRTFPRFYIRGLGNTDFDLNASQPVSFVYDDIVLENPTLKGMPIFDVDQIEVLRGPQGTLFGRNTPAGVVKVTSAMPTDEFEAYANASWATYNTSSLEGAISGPIAENMAGRLSVQLQHRDDWVDNLANGPEDELGGYNDFAWRGQILATPNDQVTALFNAHGWGSDGTARLFRANIIEPGTGGLVAGFNRDEVYFDGKNKQKVRGMGAQAKIDIDLGEHILTSVTGWKSVDVFSRGDIDGGFGAAFLNNSQPGIIPFTAESADALPDHDQFTQEIRLASDQEGPWEYMIGGFYFSEDLFIQSFNYDSLAPGNPINGYAFQNQDTTAWAVFGSANYDVNDQLNIQAGLRLSNDEKDFTAERVVSPLSFFGVPHVAQPAAQSSDEDFVSWDVSASYAANENTSLFARVAQGNRAPSFQGRLLFGDVITKADTETILSFEAGVKGTTEDGRGRYSLTGFSYTIDDQQLTAVGGGANFNQLANADKTKGFGFEAEGDFAVADNFFVSGGVSYNATEIQDPNLFIQPCGAGCTVNDPVTAGLASIDGNDLPHAPEWIANATARYTHPLASGGQLFAFADVVYESEKSFFLYDSEEFKSDNFTEFGLKLGYENEDRSIEAAIFARNLFDEEALRGGIDFNNLTGFVNEPRIIGVELKKKY
ncbi:MAG: TonB-dependent receptor [bacterium]